MTRHTYLTLMTVIRLAKGILNTWERWVRAEFDGPVGGPSPNNQNVKEE